MIKLWDELHKGRLARAFPFALAALALGGCATLESLPQNTTAAKTAGSVCATAGAAFQAIKLDLPDKLPQARKAYTILEPYCTAATPGAAMTAAEAKAYQEIVTLAAPYLEGTTSESNIVSSTAEGTK